MKKIMFDDSYLLTQAVISGRKTMTRRVVPEKLVKSYFEWREDASNIALDDIGRIETLTEFLLRCSYYKKGETIAVSQSYETIFENMKNDFAKEALKYAYRSSAGWSNKMFVRALVMRHQIRITNVRVERMQNISTDDCIREGIRPDLQVCLCDALSSYRVQYFVDGILLSGNNQIKMFSNPKHAFCNLINSISGPFTWERNPYVYVYSFELIK